MYAARAESNFSGLSYVSKSLGLARLSEAGKDRGAPLAIFAAGIPGGGDGGRFHSYG